MNKNTLLRFAGNLMCARILSLRKPILVGFSITKRCPYNCKYCFFSSNNENDISLKDIKNIIDQLCRHGTQIIQFTGGEPCLRDDLSDIAEYTKNKGVRSIALSTSGYNIHRHERALRYIDLINLSLDADKNINDKLRGIGSFDTVISAADFLKKINKDFLFRTVLSTLNLDSIDKIVTIAKEYHTKVMFQPVWFINKNEDCGIKDIVPERKLLNEILDRIIYYKDKTKVIGNSIFALKSFKNIPKFKSCVAGKIFFRVEANGDLGFCCRMESKNSFLNLIEASGDAIDRYFKIKNTYCCQDACLDSFLIELNGFYNLNPTAIGAILDYLRFIK